MFKRKNNTYKYTVDKHAGVRRGSVRWHIFSYFLLFAAIMLVLLWLLQTVFLESIYQSIKTHDIERTADHIVKELSGGGISGDEMQEYMNRVAENGSLCVHVLDMNPKGNKLLMLQTQTSGVAAFCVVHGLPVSDMMRIAEEAEAAGGSLFIREKYDEQDTESPMLLFLARCVTLSGGERYAVFLSGSISPLSATVHTLRIQLLVISGIMVLIGLMLAFLTAERVSRPIVRINKLSRRLAGGDFEVDFRQPGAYREVDELSATLNFAAQELAKTEQLQRDLIANISHDLRTPLTLITGYAEAMRDLPGENTPENVQVIIDETERLNNLVNDLLDMSKLQAGVVELSRQEIELTELIYEIRQRFNKLCSIEGYTIDFAPAAKIWVTADKVKLTQVIYNLLNNAITYTGEDKLVTVRQQLLHRDKRVRIEVVDTGKGIEPEQIENIWQRYYHGSANHRRSSAGNGLGLYIVKTILDMHGGAYGVESTPGRGSCFWFELEVCRVETLSPEN